MSFDNQDKLPKELQEAVKAQAILNVDKRSI
jgi:hypothetical protein